MNEVWMLRTLRWAYVAFIAAASGVAVYAGALGTGQAKHGPYIVLALAIPELLAALAFLVEPLEVAACAVLLFIYAAATALSLASGDFLAPLRFLYFAATAIFIVQGHRGIQARMQRVATTA
jgi:hypothetical protein